VDLPATFPNWAGATTPARDEGTSLAPLVEGAKDVTWRTSFFCEHVDLAPFITW